MPNKQVGQTKVMGAITEIVEDRIADAVRHCQDVTTVDGKPCEVNVKIVITPNKSRDQFTFKVAGGVKLSPRYPAEAMLFASVDKESDEVIVQEYDPQQEIPFTR